MKNSHKILLGAILFSMLFSVGAFNNVLADDTIDTAVQEDLTYQIEANVRTTFRYMQQTQLTINCDVDCEGYISCEFQKIGAKDFEIEIDGTEDLQLNMTCTEEEAELGLLLGERYTVRNRNRYLYQEGFCVSLQCNTSFIQARLRIQATAQNGGGLWAYYNDSTDEWVTVPTTTEDGYLVATIDHFSYWTILIPESDLMFFITIVAIIVGLIAAVSIVGIVIYMKKR